MRRTLPLTGVIVPSFVLLLAASTAAQPAPTPPPAKPNAAAKPPSPADKPGSSASAPTTPPKIEINDPLLATVPPPPHLLGSWRDALTLISSRSVELAIAEQEIARAQGLSRQALAGALTSVNATGSMTYQLLQDNATGPLARANPTIAGSLTVSQPILAPRAWYAIGTAELSVKSAKLSVEDKRRTSLAQVAEAIVGVYTGERVAEISRVGLRSSLERLDLAQRKARLGDGTRLDVLRVQQDVSAARGTLIAGDEALRKAREALGLALGSSEGFGVPPTISLDEMEQSLKSSCSAASVEKRADVAQARNDLEIAQRQITDVKLAFSPTALIATTASISNQEDLNQRNTAWRIEGVLSIPIWEGGARYGALRVARAGAEQAKLRLDAAMRGATLESNQALRVAGVAEQARQVAEQNRDLAREAARLSERAFAAGVGTSFDLVDSGRREREAELDLTVREFELIKAKIAALLASANCAY
jgi:outer membrane protein TolC